MADFVASSAASRASFAVDVERVTPLTNQPLEQLSRDIVTRLRERSPGGLLSAIQPLLDIQHRLVGDCAAGTVPIEQVQGTLIELQNVIVQTLATRYDALDTAARISELPFAELDHTGRIVYANAAFAGQLPSPVGRDFAGLFGSRADDMAELMRLNQCASLRVELECEGLPRQFRAEIGPLADEDGKPGHYAVLLGLRAEEQRLDAALDAIIRTDRSGRIVFANNKAFELLQATRTELLNTDLGRWLVPRNPDQGDPITKRIGAWIAATESVIDNDLTLIDAAGQAHPINAASVPVYDGEKKSAGGILITFRDAAEDLARAALRRLVREETDWRELIRKAIRIIGTVVPYDMAAFGTYSSNGKLYRAQIVEPVPAWRWATRWFDVGPAARAWLETDQTFTDDTSGLSTDDQKTDPVAIAVREEGLKNLVCLPVRGTAGEFRCVMSLLSRTQKYGANHLRALRDLGIEEVFLVAQATMDKQQEKTLRKLNKNLNKAPTVRALAEGLAKGVVKSFDWEYAAVYRIDRKPRPDFPEGHFQLFEQCDTTDDQSLIVDSSYRQDIRRGMLGYCYREGKVLVLPRVRRDGEKYDFIKVAGQESAMTIPLRLNGRIEFILDIESSQENSFAGSDKKQAEALAIKCEQILASRWSEAISFGLMDTMEQAAIIVDDVGSIRRLNAAARGIFGEVKDVPLQKFGAEKADQDILAQTRNSDPVRVVLSSAPGVRILMMAEQHPLHDDYGHRLWLFSNLGERDRELDRSFLEATVNEVARQARAPLMIADGLVRGAADLVGKPDFTDKCADLLTRAANQLLKADLTYDRLSGSLNARTEPMDAPSPFDAVKLLRNTIGRLPPDDREQIDWSIAENLAFGVEGWSDRFAYALRSILGFLLLSDRKGKVVVEAGPGDGGSGLRIRLSARRRRSAALAKSPDDELTAKDPIAEKEEAARRLVALSPESVRKSIELHHGELVMPGPDEPETTFIITLPGAEKRR